MPGFAFAEQVTSIAFRTQVTEAQQEFLYYLCQLRANSVLSDDEVSANLRHFQNTMLAMVAIDDLAGGSRFKPAPTDTTPSGQTQTPAPPDASDPKVAAVKAAQTGADDARNKTKKSGTAVDAAAKEVMAVTKVADLKSKTDALSAALKSYDGQQTAYSKKIATLQSAVKALKGADGKAPDEVNSAAATADEAAKGVKTDYKKVTDAVMALANVSDPAHLTAAQGDVKPTLDAYTKSVGIYLGNQDALKKAVVAWNGTAAGDDKKKATVADKGSDATAAVTATVANDIAIIVQTIVWQSFVTETCQKGLFENFNQLDVSVRQFCLDHMKLADRVRAVQLLGPLMVSGVPATPKSNLIPASSVPVTPSPLYELVIPQSFQPAADNAAFQKKQAAAPAPK
jgi:hypothetical protein